MSLHSSYPPVATTPSPTNSFVFHRADAWAALTGDDERNAFLDEPPYTPESSVSFSLSRPNSLMPAPLKQTESPQQKVTAAAAARSSLPYSTDDSSSFSLPNEGSSNAGTGTPRTGRESETGSEAWLHREPDNYSIDETSRTILYAARDLWLTSVLNRVLILYYSRQYNDALILANQAYHQSDIRKEPSLFCRAALWKALVLEKVGSPEEVVSTLPYALVLYQGDNTLDQMRLLKLLRKHADNVTTWLQTQEGTDTTETHVSGNAVDFVLKALESKFEHHMHPTTPSLPSSVLEENVQEQENQSNDSNRPVCTPDTVSPLSSNNGLQSTSDHQQHCSECFKLRAENQALKNTLVSSLASPKEHEASPLESRDSTFEDLFADTQVNRTAFPSEYCLSPGEAFPYLGQTTAVPRHGEESYHVHGHTLPNRRHRVEEIDTDTEGDEDDETSRVEAIGTHEAEKIHFNTNVFTSVAQRRTYSIESQAITDSESVNTKDSDMDFPAMAPDERELTDTPGGEELDDLAQGITARRNSTERLKSLPGLITNIEHSLESTTWPGARGSSFSTNTTSPSSPSLLRRFSKSFEVETSEPETD